MTAAADALSALRPKYLELLEQLEQQLPPLRAQLATAQRASAAARAEIEALVGLASAGVSAAGEGMARVLHADLEEKRHELLRDPRCDAATPARQIDSLLERIADLRLALAQIERALEPRAPVRQLVPRPRHQAEASDFTPEVIGGAA